MGSLLSSNQISILTGVLGQHFDTFTQERTRLITIYKEPIKNISVTRTNPMYGYGDDSVQEHITYTEVTGIFPAMITYNLIQKTTELEELKNTVSKGEVRIKVEQNARDFIEDGRRNEKFLFDGKTFNTITDDGIQNYLGLVYYIYRLQRTN